MKVFKKAESIFEALAAGFVRFWLVCLVGIYLCKSIGLEGNTIDMIIGVVAIATGLFETIKWIFRIVSIVKGKKIRFEMEAGE